MIKSKLVRKVAVQTPHFYQKDVDRIISAIFDTITEALCQGKRVELRGFGSFSIRNRPAHMGRNPRTGEQVPVDQKFAPFFKAGKEIRDRINKERTNS